MYLRKHKISKAVFLENTYRQPSLYVIWFRVSPKRKYYFMWETYLKPSQTSKMKLARVVNASRDVFRSVFSIQNVFRTYSEHLTWSFYKYNERLKAVNFFHKKLHLRYSVGSWKCFLISVFNYFHKKLHLRSLRGQICLCMYLVPQIWRWINEISKVGYEETQKNV